MIFQWPNIYIKPKKFFKEKNYEKNFLKKTIQKYFFNMFKHENMVVPSARSGISLILKYMNLQRSNEIFVNKWSSRCILDTVSFFSNPTTNLETSNAFIINHTWGQEKKINLRSNKIIEDSADSIHLSSKSFFINNSTFEVISLPKIIGSYAGGIIFFKDKKFKNFVSTKIKSNKYLSIEQSKLKYNYSKTLSKKFLYWQHNEYENFDADYNTLANINENIKNFNINKKLILERQKIVSKKFGIIFNSEKRIGPVAFLDMCKFRVKSKNFKLPIYHVNFSKNPTNTTFIKCLIFPIHFGISNKKFNKILSAIVRK